MGLMGTSPHASEAQCRPPSRPVQAAVLEKTGLSIQWPSAHIATSPERLSSKTPLWEEGCWRPLRSRGTCPLGSRARRGALWPPLAEGSYGRLVRTMAEHRPVAACMARLGLTGL